MPSPDYIAEGLWGLCLPIADCVPDPENANTHPAGNLAAIAGSLRLFKQTRNCVGRTRELDGKIVIYAGNGLLDRAIALGWQYIAVVLRDDLTEAEAREYALADNRTSALASFDEKVLAAQLEKIDPQRRIDFGFDASEFARLQKVMAEATAAANAGKGEENDPDAVPARPTNPVSELGTVWLMGRHRVICGDSTKASVVETVLGNAKPLIMVTDPPYGVGYDPGWRNREGVDSAGSTPSLGEVANDDEFDWSEAYQHFPGDVAYVWHQALRAGDVQTNLRTAGYECRSHIVWVKGSLVISRGAYHWQHEPCWYAVRKGKTAEWAGDRKQSTVWEIASLTSARGNVDDGKTEHGTQKPVACMERPIRNHAFTSVYDPFLGSGTTVIAAERAGAACYGCELMPAYVDVIVRRWCRYTGLDATREPDGASFRELESKGPDA